MEPAVLAFIGTIVGTIVGAGSSIVTTIITASNAGKLQKTADDLERHERAREFQRNNLLELQESLSSAMRLVGRAYLHDAEALKQQGEPTRSLLLPEDLNQEIASSNRKLSVLTERIADDALRDSINSLRQNMTTVLMARVRSDLESAMNIAASSFDETMPLLGKVLRQTY